MSSAAAQQEFPLVDLTKVEPRLYQQNLYRSALKDNTLLVLPTGLGKTVVALMLAGKAVGDARGDKGRRGACVVVLAPTKPLVEQHASFFRENLVGAGPPDRTQHDPGEGRVVVADMTGEVDPAERESLFLEADVVIATPQVVRNDLAAERVSLAGVRLLVLDEAHRAAGDYPYVSLAKTFRAQAGARGRLLGLTASPGGNARDILAVCEALGIQQIDVRTEEDIDVAPYVHEIAVNWIEVDLPGDFKVIAAKLRRMFDREARKLQDAGLVRRGNFASAGDIIRARQGIQAGLARLPPQERGPWWALASAQARAMKLNHALEYIETQGSQVFLSYMDRLREEAAHRGGSAASRALAKDPDFAEAYALAKTTKAQHPKVETAAKLVARALKADPEGRIILFAHFRETGEVLLKRLEAVEGARAVRFVGQAARGNDAGLSQKEQVEVIEKFEEGAFNVLVATSVAEEGLDIPQVDHVIFYEPVPSEIRTIQRRGRTGRRRAGSVEVLVARKTRDEAYMRAASARESTMREELKRLRVNLRLPIEVLDAPAEGEVARRLENFKATDPPAETDPAPKGSLEAFGERGSGEPPASIPARQVAPPAEEGPQIFADDRELRGPLVDALRALGVRVVPQRLAVGDFACPPQVGVERKTIRDFAASLSDGRLFAQAEALAQAYERPVLLIEGDEASGFEGVAPEAFHGAVARLITDLHLSVLRTRDPRGSAQALAGLARRAGRTGATPPSGAPRTAKTGLTVAETQLAVLEGLPGVSHSTAVRLLAHFGTIRALSQASLEEIAAVPGVPRRTAEQIFQVLHAAYPADGA